VGVDHEELPATYLGRHGKTAGGATLRTGKGPSLFLKLGHGVGQVLIVELERFPMQEPGLLGEREVQAKPAHLPHRSDLPKDPGQLGHERSRLGIIEVGDHDRDPETMPCWGCIYHELSLDNEYQFWLPRGETPVKGPGLEEEGKKVLSLLTSPQVS
jgi:hypothetical protein